MDASIDALKPLGSWHAFLVLALELIFGLLTLILGAVGYRYIDFIYTAFGSGPACFRKVADNANTTTSWNDDPTDGVGPICLARFDLINPITRGYLYLSASAHTGLLSATTALWKGLLRRQQLDPSAREECPFPSASRLMAQSALTCAFGVVASVMAIMLSDQLYTDFWTFPCTLGSSEYACFIDRRSLFTSFITLAVVLSMSSMLLLAAVAVVHCKRQIYDNAFELGNLEEKEAIEALRDRLAGEAKLVAGKVANTIKVAALALRQFNLSIENAGDLKRQAERLLESVLSDIRGKNDDDDLLVKASRFVFPRLLEDLERAERRRPLIQPAPASFSDRLQDKRNERGNMLLNRTDYDDVFVSTFLQYVTPPHRGPVGGGAGAGAGAGAAAGGDGNDDLVNL